MFRPILHGLRTHFRGFLPAHDVSSVGEAASYFDAAPDTGGQVEITYTPGKKAALSADEVTQPLNRHPDRFTEDEIVWPGKTVQLLLINDKDERLDYRFELTVTNLPASYYVVSSHVVHATTGGESPQGNGVLPHHAPRHSHAEEAATQQQKADVLLSPGEEALFTVRFLPSVLASAQPHTFAFVMKRFDPRHRSDPGTVIDEAAARWIPLPAASDLALTAEPSEVCIRPWRRQAPFRIAFQNHSYFPSSVQLHILRAPTKEALTQSPEQVGLLRQSLGPRRADQWCCVLPANRWRGSYYATAQGIVRMGEHRSWPLALSRPVLVRYVPWLRRGRDWVVVCGSLFASLCLFTGIPVFKAPTVHLTLGLELPRGASWDDLRVKAVALDTQGRPGGEEVLGSRERDGTFRLDLPGRWYWYRWPSGWSRWSQQPQRFRVAVGFPEGDRQAPFAAYNLNPKTSDGGNLEFSLEAKDRPLQGAWTIHRRVSVPWKTELPIQASLPPPRVEPRSGRSGSAGPPAIVGKSLSADTPVPSANANIQKRPAALPPTRHPPPALPRSKERSNRPAEPSNAVLKDPSEPFQAPLEGSAEPANDALRDPSERFEKPSSGRSRQSRPGRSGVHNTVVSHRADPSILNHLAYRYLACGDFERSFAVAQEAIQQETTRRPADTEAHAVKALLLAQERKSFEAEQVQQEIDQVARSVSLSPAQLREMPLHEASQRMEKALQRAPAQRRAFSLALTAQALLCQNQDRLKEKEAALYFLAEQADEEQVLAYACAADHFYSVEIPATAESQYRDGMQKNARSAAFHYQFALVYKKFGTKFNLLDRARSEFKRALELDPHGKEREYTQKLAKELHVSL